MCFGIFISPVFIHDSGMVRMILGWGTKESIKAFCIQKKVIRLIRLITGIKKYETCRQKFKENRILNSDINVCFRSLEKNIGETVSKIVRSMNKIRETNMTFIPNPIIQLYFRKVCYTWALDCIITCT